MIKITARGQTDVGMKRDHNEDYFDADDDLQLYVVCDGMGGHASGEVASKLACENIFNFVRQHRGSTAGDMPYSAYGAEDFDSILLSNAVQYGNERVYIEGMKDSKLEGMGTTLVAMMVAGQRMILAHVGDSRIYRFNTDSGQLKGLTRDHSLLNHKIDLGELQTEEEIKNFKQGNVIVRAVGLKDEVRPEVQSVPISEGDLFLLCSDGLSDLVDDWAIENVMTGLADELEEAASTFIRMANDRGGKDNITALLVRIESLTSDGTSSDDDEEHVTEPTIPKVDPASNGLPKPSWLADADSDDALEATESADYDDTSEWQERNDYGELFSDHDDSESSDNGNEEPSDWAETEKISDSLDEDDLVELKSLRDEGESVLADDEATPIDRWADTDRVSDELDDDDLKNLRSAEALYELEVPEQVALVVLAKRLIIADGSISLSEMQHLNELSGVVGQSVFRQADQVNFPNDNAFVGFLNTVHRAAAQKTIFQKLLEIAVSDSLVPAESALLTMVAEHWNVSLPGAGGPKKKRQGGPPPVPNARRAAKVTDPAMQAVGRRVGAIKSDPADELPSIIIDDEV